MFKSTATGLAFFAVVLAVALLGMILVGSASAMTATANQRMVGSAALVGESSSPPSTTAERKAGDKPTEYLTMKDTPSGPPASCVVKISGSLMTISC